MNIEINNKINDLSVYEFKKFINYLINELKLYILSNIDDRKLSRWDIYLNKNNVYPKFVKQDKRTISAKNIIYSAVNNIEVKYFNEGSKCIIEINQSEKLPNFDITILNAAKLIDSGNMSIQGYPIISNSFKYFNDNLMIYWNKYQEEAD